MVLTDKQRHELHVAILDYLDSQESLQSVCETFAAASGVELRSKRNGGNNESAAAAADDGIKGLRPHMPLLEKKWTSVVRLQRKVLDLEAKLKDAQTSGASISAAGANGQLRPASESFLLKTTSLKRLSGHRAPVTCTAFHPKFNLIVSGSEDASIKLWDFETGDFERTLKGHTNIVQDLSFNADGSLLASCSADMSVKLWSFSPSGAYECVKTLLGHDHNVSGVQFIPSGSQLLSCSRDQTIKLWDTSSGFCLKTLTGHDDWVRKIAVHQSSAGGLLVASCSNDQSIIVWSPSSNEPEIVRLKGHEHVVECVAFSSGAVDRSLLVDQQGSPNQTAATRTSKKEGGLHVISGSRDKTIKIWQVASGACLMTLDGHDNWVRAVACQPCGKYLLSASEDKTIRIWDLSQQRCIRTIANAHSHFISTLSIHPTLGLVATASVDQTIALWVAAPHSS